MLEDVYITEILNIFIVGIVQKIFKKIQKNSLHTGSHML